jgi:hypothetical protein
VSTAGPVALPPPAVSEPGLVERIVRSPGRFCLAMLAITTLGLALDRYADLGIQMLLAVCAWGFLAIAFVYLTPMERAQTSVVVVVATMAEVIGSVIWGIYSYRLGNLPLFVPPGHGLVYLTGLRLSQTRWPAARPRAFVGLAIAAVTTWALLGVVVFERRDVAGAVGAAILVLFLLRGRAPAVYAGVFFAVAYLEIYGTAVGTWTWHEEIPGLGVADGNPPSGAACGYVFFDIAALYLAPSLLAAWVALRRRVAPSEAAAVDRRVVLEEADPPGVAQALGQQPADGR